MITQIWDTTLDTNTLNSYADAATQMNQQRIPPIVVWEAAVKMPDWWIVVVTFLLGPQEIHPAVFKLTTLLEAADEVKSCLRAQARVQQEIPAALFRLIQTKFNKSFRQVFTSHLSVRWPHFIPLIITLTTSHLYPGTVTMPGDFHTSIPAALTPQRTAALLLKTSAPAQRGGDTSTHTTKVAVQNPTPTPHFQVEPGF